MSTTPLFSALFGFGFTFAEPSGRVLQTQIADVVMTCGIAPNGDCHFSARSQWAPVDSSLTVIAPAETLTVEDYAGTIRSLHRRCAADQSMQPEPLPTALVATDGLIATLETLWQKACATDPDPEPGFAVGAVNDSLCMVGPEKHFAFLPLLEPSAWPLHILVDRPLDLVANVLRLANQAPTIRLYLHDAGLLAAGYTIPGKSIARVKE